MAKDQNLRILIGTRKGTYIAAGDRRRRSWKVGPVAHTGSDVYHVVADPRHPGHLYAAVNNAFWGPMVQGSRNFGGSWKELGTPLTPLRKERTPMFDDSNPTATPRRPLTNLWHIEPGSAEDSNAVYLGGDPHLLFRSDDLGSSWSPVNAINEHPKKKDWAPGAGGHCLHTIMVDHKDPARMYVGLSAVGTFRSQDGGATFSPVNRNVICPFLPKGQQFPETGQCVHHVAVDGADPRKFYRQDHGGMYVSRDDMESWQRIGKPLGDDFGFCVASPRGSPGRAYFVRLDGEARVTGDGHFQVQEWNEKTRKWTKLLSPKQFPGHFGVQREGIATDAQDNPGIYVGTTTGQLFVSPDGGDSWLQVPFAFPSIHSVAVSDPSA